MLSHSYVKAPGAQFPWPARRQSEEPAQRAQVRELRCGAGLLCGATAGLKRAQGSGSDHHGCPQDH